MTKKKLVPAFKRRWLAALRSGAFKQGHDELHYRGAFCCLGVAAQISGCYIEPGESYPPDFAMSGWGLTQEAAEKLTELNDGKPSGGDRRHSFAEIADYIEKNL